MQSIAFSADCNNFYKKIENMKFKGNFEWIDNKVIGILSFKKSVFSKEFSFRGNNIVGSDFNFNEIKCSDLGNFANFIFYNQF